MLQYQTSRFVNMQKVKKYTSKVPIVLFNSNHRFSRNPVIAIEIRHTHESMDKLYKEAKFFVNYFTSVAFISFVDIVSKN